MQLADYIADAEMEIVDGTPLHATFGIPDAKLVAPGNPGRSLLIHRPAVRGTGQMPPLGTLKPDPDGVALLAKWISDMKPVLAPPKLPAEKSRP